MNYWIVYESNSVLVLYMRDGRPYITILPRSSFKKEYQRVLISEFKERAPSVSGAGFLKSFAGSTGRWPQKIVRMLALGRYCLRARCCI